MERDEDMENKLDRQLVESTKLSPKHKAWVLRERFEPLNRAYNMLMELEVAALVDRNAAARQAYTAASEEAKRLIELIDESYIRVFSPGPAFEDAYQACDGEITFACAEALKRLRRIVGKYV